MIEQLLLLKHQGITNVCLVTGRAKDGPDDMAYHFARWDRPMPYLEMPADWKTHGKAAGMLRNVEMEKVSDELLAFWDGESRGTQHMCEIVRRAKKPSVVYVERVGEDPEPLEIVRFD